MKRKTVAALITLAALSVSSVFSQQNQPTGTTGFGKSYSIAYLTQLNVQLQNGQSLGKLKDVIIDLVSGRTLYAVVPSGGTWHAVPTQLFAASPTGTNLVLNTDAQKLQSAPVVSGTTIGDVNYIAQVFNHFGVPAWWGPTATGRGNESFGSPQWANYLRGRQVQTSSAAQLGSIQNVLIDLQNGRVPFLLLTSSQAGQSGQLYPIPAMAFNVQNGKFVTGVDQNKLQGAPKLAADTAQQLQDASFATQVYQYYGKQPYWTTPTSSQPGTRVYPEIGPSTTNTFPNQ